MINHSEPKTYRDFPQRPLALIYTLTLYHQAQCLVVFYQLAGGKKNGKAGTCK